MSNFSVSLGERLNFNRCQKKKIRKVKRGEIYTCKLESGVGSEQSGDRPALIIQNNIGNTYSPTTIVAFITSEVQKKCLATQFEITLDKDSLVLCEQIRTIDKSRLGNKIGELTPEEMDCINTCLKVSLDL